MKLRRLVDRYVAHRARWRFGAKPTQAFCGRFAGGCVVTLISSRLGSANHEISLWEGAGHECVVCEA